MSGRRGEMAFSQKFVCLNCGASAPEITPGLFSFNSPEALVPRCNGLGELAERGNVSKIALPYRARVAAARA